MIRALQTSLSPRFAALLACALLLGAATAARADRWERDDAPAPGPWDAHRGVYFAGGVGAGVQLVGYQDSAAAGQGELRLGYSFGRRFQIYLDADLSGSSHDFGRLTASDVMIGLRYFLYTDRFVGVYVRGALGLGIVTGVNAIYNDGIAGDDTEYGIAESYALGMEFRLGGPWSISPEVFYRRTNETNDIRVDTLGIGLLINFN